MTSPDGILEPVPPTPARPQRAVATVAFLALLACGPGTWITTGPLAIQGVAVAAPEFTTDAFLDGSWTERFGRWLARSSSLAQHFQERAIELQWLLGRDEAEFGDVAVQPTPGWLFLGDALRNPDPTTWSPLRRRYWSEVAARAARLGVDVVVAIAPDKARVEAEFVYPDGRLPANRVSRYELGLTEIREAGLVAVDVTPAMRSWRRDYPADPPYLHLDSHWSLTGATLAAEQIAAAVRALGRDLGPPADLELNVVRRMELSYLARNAFGFRHDGLAQRRFQEAVRYPAVLRIGPDGGRELLPAVVPDAPVAMCGDSFAEACAQVMVPVALDREVDTVGVVPATAPWQGLDGALDRIERGELRARVVVCLFVERSLVTVDWAGRVGSSGEGGR
ncbi:MAG: hypothetical protein IPM29_08915 [Planctomycetes bacterium]|nr:hypothetical protein [Planctomycetota bacterium]